MITILTATVMVAITAAATGGSGACGGGWGQWSVPINTMLLIVLAAMNLHSRRRIENRVKNVQEVTDTVRLRKDDQPNRKTD